MAKLTKSFIDKLVPPDHGYALHWDEQDRGFGLRITATGKRSFFVQGRANGKELRVTIGPYGVFTVDQARDEAREQLRSMRKGNDPREARRVAKASQVTLRTVADEYMTRPGKLKDSSKDAIERHVVTTFKAFLDRPINEITEAYCLKRYRELYAGGLHGDRKEGSPGQANQAFAIMKALLNYAIRRYKTITVNPVSAALRDEWKELEPRDSYIPAAKIGAVWSYLTTLRDQTYNRTELSGVDAVMFLILTGARLEEALKLTWDRVNLEEGWYHLPDPKNRRPIWLPLSTQSVTLLNERPRVKGNDHVFPGKNSGAHLSDTPREIWTAISTIAGIELRNHDARRSFTTLGVTECKLDLYKIDLLIGHKPSGVVMKHYLDTKRLQWLKPEVQAYADWIENKAAVAKAVAAGNVVQLPARKTG